MNIDVAKLQQILARGPHASLGALDIDDKPAVVAVILDLRHLDEAKAWVGGLLEREKGGAA